MIARPIADSAGGLRPPTRRVAAARAKYQSDGATGLTGGKLLVALYDRLVRDLSGAEAAIESRQIEGAHQHLVHAQDIVDSLEDALDAEAWEQADQMGALYRHLRRQLVAANVRKDATLVATCRELVEPMAATWRDALDLTTATVATAAP